MFNQSRFCFQYLYNSASIESDRETFEAMGMTRGAPQKPSSKGPCAAGESLGVSQHATPEHPELEEATHGVTPQTPEQLRLKRLDAWS